MAALTRGHFAVLLAQWLGLDVSRGGGFSDTKGSYFDGATTALKNLGITTGIGGGRFGAGQPMTRAQAATMLARAFEISPSTRAAFGDVARGSYYEGAVNALAELGVFTGTRPGTFSPNAALEKRHLDIIFSRMTSAGYGPENFGQEPPPPPMVNNPLPPSPDDPPPVTLPDDEPMANRDDYLAVAKRMLTETFDVPWSDAMGRFIDRAWDEGWTDEDIGVFMYDEQWFKDRFKGMADRSAKGLKAISAEEYLDLERGYAEEMRRAGLPPGFYDDPEDFRQFIAADRSIAEVRDDIVAQFQRINEAPQEVRSYFADIYGVDGDSALAAFFLDPDRGAQLLDEVATVGEIGGTARRFGFDLTSERAMRLASLGVDIDSASRGFSELAKLTPLFEETIGEGIMGEDLEAENEGLDYAFGVDGRGFRAIENRRRRRIAAFSGGSSVAADESGMFGLGTAQ